MGAKKKGLGRRVGSLAGGGSGGGEAQRKLDRRRRARVVVVRNVFRWVPCRPFGEGVEGKENLYP